MHNIGGKYMNKHKMNILSFINEHSSIFTHNFFHQYINGQEVSINSLYYVLNYNDLLVVLSNNMDSTNINELLYIIFFISKLRSYFHFSRKSMEIINIKLVHIENILFNILLEQDNNEIDIDEIINITNKLSSSAKISDDGYIHAYSSGLLRRPSDYEMTKHKSYNNKQTYTKYLCICVKISQISPTILPNS